MALPLLELEERGDWEGLISRLRDMVADDRTVLGDPLVKQWLGRRWRNLFIAEATRDEKALEVASRPVGLVPVKRPPLLPDHKSPQQRIAERFLKGDTVTDWHTELPPPDMPEVRNTTMVIAPGLLTGLLNEFAYAFLHEAPVVQEEFGWPIIRSDLHPFRGCDANHDDLVATLDRGEGFDAAMQPITDPTPPDKVILVGYSKGAPDVLTFLAANPEYADRVVAMFSWAGANGGSYTADNIYATIKDLDISSATERMRELLSLLNPGVVTDGMLRRLDEYDVVGAFESLTTEARLAFLRRESPTLNALGIPFFTVSGATSPLEVPNFQLADTLSLQKYDANNDMQLLQSQARLDTVEMSTHLAVLHGHHWDIAYPPFPRQMQLLSPNLDNPFPKRAALVAMWQLTGELGLVE